MNNFSKMLVGSSLVLGAVLFSVGCGGDSFCCKDGEPPIPKIDGDAKTIKLGNHATTHIFTGLQDAGKDDGSVVKCKWYIDGKLQSYTNNECANVELNFAGMSGKPEVCLEVIDNEGLSSTLNNGKIEKDKVGASAEKPTNSPIELRKKMDCKYVAITSITGPNPAVEISVSKPTFTKGCLLATAGIVAASPGEGTITNYAWTIDGNDAGEGSDVKSPTYDFNELGSGEHEICLVVTNSLGTTSKRTNASCKKVTAEDYKVPTAILDVKQGGIDVTELNVSSNYDLSCKNSSIHCPNDTKNYSCEFHGRSYKADADGDCVYDISRAFISDCATDHMKDSNNDAKSKLTPSEVQSDVKIGLTTCSSVSDFNCVDLWVTVKDEKVKGYESTSDISTFKVK